MHAIRDVSIMREPLDKFFIGSAAHEGKLQIAVQKSEDVQNPDGVAESFAALQRTNAQYRAWRQWAVVRGLQRVHRFHSRRYIDQSIRMNSQRTPFVVFAARCPRD